MAYLRNRQATNMGPHVGRSVAMLTAGLLLSACSQAGGALKPDALALTEPTVQDAVTHPRPQSELEKATQYWGQQYAKNPRNLEAAMGYALNLKAMGQKRQALAVLQQASLFHSQDRKLASEYGRLALEFDQVSVAKQLLEAADDPANPDWRVISARGTVFAKEGLYSEAIPYYERALTLAPDHPSLLNNLALAYTLTGEAKRGEEILTRVAQGNHGNPKLRQNLALMLAVQGKYDEAKVVASRDLPSESAAANTEYLRKLVRLEQRPEAATQTVATSAPAGPGLKQTVEADQGELGPWSPQVAESTEPGQLKPSKR